MKIDLKQNMSSEFLIFIAFIFSPQSNKLNWKNDVQVALHISLDHLASLEKSAFCRDKRVRNLVRKAE